MDPTLDPQDTHAGPSAESLEPSPTHVNCVGQTKFFVPKQFEIRSFVCSDRIDISVHLGQLPDSQPPRSISYPPKVNSLPDVNLRSSQTHLGQFRDRQLPRSVSCPPNVNVNLRSSQTHHGQSHDHQLPRPTGCSPNVNSLPRPTSCLPNVNSQPDGNRRSRQTHLGQLRDRQLPRPTGCPPDVLIGDLAVH